MLFRSVYEGSDGYNEAIYLNEKKLSSKPYPYTELQKDLVFDLDRGGNIRFWFKSEIGSTTDTLIRIGDTILTGLPLNDRQLQKVYTTGFWKMNFKDSTLVLNFGTKLPEIHFKYPTSEGSYSSFQQITFFDSVYNGKKVTFKKVITTSYEHSYINF